ncbi:hypothetical protein HK097_010459 [Rhizophlyctis rosea]|uniref:Fibronectin type-III domain-containing protein n=1 Tax=Rhizophlyctis rosea TaxID=64517 RepID=A0AAD5S9V4_9FUNG|nr:hypothetical protein HK097_010459 [Rhizophlyctis rosea]
MRFLSIATLATFSLGAVQAVLPIFPNNLVLFPNRDFVTIEGFTSFTGKNALIKVHRGTTIAGSAIGTISGDADLAFEINHPGGVCWGAGTDLNVTPDLQPGDRVSITIDGVEVADSVVQNAYVEKINYVDGATSFTVTGFIAAGIDTANVEQRFINTAMINTAIGRRDARALPGPLTADRNNVYRSQITFSGTTFTATYIFTDPVLARLVATGGGARLMSWQLVDPAGNRQGLTIAEMDELGGPGMGGCPPGPADVGAPVSTYSATFSADRKTATVVWNPVAALPGADPVTGYDVQFIGFPNAGISGTVGRRTIDTIRQVQITDLDPLATYTIAVRSVSGDVLSRPFTTVYKPNPGPAPGVPPSLFSVPSFPATADTVMETSTVSFASTGVIFYTIGNVEVLTGDQPSDSAILYTKPVPVTAATTIHVASFQEDGLFTIASIKVAPVGSTVKPPTPLNVVASTAEGKITLAWTPIPNTSSYRISEFDAVTNTLLRTLTTTGEETLKATILISTGLTAGKQYAYTIAAQNSFGTFGAESSKVTATPSAPVDTVIIQTSRSQVGDFRLSGTGSVNGATITVYRVAAGGGVGPAIPGATAQVAGATAQVAGTWSIRVRTLNDAPTAVYVKSSGGATVGPVTMVLKRR